MKHTHEYEAVYHPIPSVEMKALGIKAAEIRKCKICQREITLFLTKDGWHPIFEEREADEKDILLA